MDEVDVELLDRRVESPVQLELVQKMEHIRSEQLLQRNPSDAPKQERLTTQQGDGKSSGRASWHQQLRAGYTATTWLGMLSQGSPVTTSRIMQRAATVVETNQKLRLELEAAANEPLSLQLRLAQHTAQQAQQELIQLRTQLQLAQHTVQRASDQIEQLASQLAAQQQSVNIPAELDQRTVLELDELEAAVLMGLERIRLARDKARLAEHEAACNRLRQQCKKLAEDFECPITLDIMRDPVIGSDGHSYERAALEGWLANGNTTSPKTNDKLVTTNMIPNHSLRSLIVAWHQGQL